MTNYSASNPFMVVLNKAGTGLNDGKVYIGQPGQDPQVYPKTVYWDLAGTIVAAQPIRTTGGYLYRSGSPAELYLSGTYSIRVTDKNDVEIYYQAVVNDPIKSFLESLPFTFPDPVPGSSYIKLSVPESAVGAGDGFVDNVLTIQNNSHNGTVAYGNAAIRFTDAAGTERSAIGYSRNSLIQPAGFYGDALYLECGNAKTTDSVATDILFVNTYLPGGPYHPAGLSLRALRYSSQLARFTFRAEGNNSNSIVNIGPIGETVMETMWGGNTTGIRIREYEANNQFSFTTNVKNMLTGGVVSFDNSAIPAWKISMGGGQDRMAFSRTDSTNGLWADYLIVNGGVAGTGGDQGRVWINLGAASNGSDGQLAVKTALNRPAISGVSDNGQACFGAWNQQTTGNNSFVTFGTEAAFTVRGSITYNRTGGVVAYNTTSDYRAKTVKGEVTGALDRIRQLAPKMVRMNGAEEDITALIAHEAAAIYAYAVTGEKDAVDEAGNPILQQVNYAAFVPELIAATKEMTGIIADLQAQISELKEAATTPEEGEAA